MSALSLGERIALRKNKVAENASKGRRVYRWKPGKTLFRIIPGPLNGDECVFGERIFGQMWLKSFDGGTKFTIGDRHITYGEEDPIRNMIFAAMGQASSDEVRDHFKEMLASTKYVFQASIISVNGAPDADSKPDQPVLVDLSEKQYLAVVAQFEAYAEMDPTYDLASLDRGHLFSIEKQGSGFDTTYTVLATPQVAPISQALVDKQINIDAWIEGEFEGMEMKAREFLTKIGAAAGMTLSSVSTPALTSSAGTKAEPAASTTGLSSDLVTKELDDDAAFLADATAVSEIEDAIYTAVEEPAEAAKAAAAAALAASKTQVDQAAKVKASADKPAEAEAQAAAKPAAAVVESQEIDDILASLMG